MPSKNSYHISIDSVLDSFLEQRLKHRIKQSTGPLKGLGFLGEVAIRLGLIKKSLKPDISHTVFLLFAADHGIADAHLIPDPQDATYQRVQLFLNGKHKAFKAAEKEGIIARLVDIGINYSLEKNFNYWLHTGNRLIDRKISFGTNNFLQQTAMRTDDCLEAIETGRQLVKTEKERGCECVIIAQLAYASGLSCMALYAGFNNNRICSSGKFDKNLLERLEKAIKRDPITHDVITLLSLYGSLEITSAIGAMLEAARLRLPFITENQTGLMALYVASKINVNVLQYAFIAGYEDTALSQKLVEELEIGPSKKKKANTEGVLALAYFKELEKAINLFK